MTEQNQDPAKPYWDEQQRQLMLEHEKRAQSLLAPPGSDLAERLKRSERARKSLSDAVDFLQRRERQLETTLKLATKWGIRSDDYSAQVSNSIREWVDAGMKGDAPKQPDYYPNIALSASAKDKTG